MRDAEPSGIQPSKVYVWPLEREQQAHQRPGCTMPWTPEQPSYTGLLDRLATLRAGCAVNVAVSELPRYVRVGMDTRWWNRATVSPDGSITLTVDCGECAAENGAVGLFGRTKVAPPAATITSDRPPKPPRQRMLTP
jgi:hypothetical protein